MLASILDFNPELDFKLLLLAVLLPLFGYIVQMTLRARLPHGDKLLTGGMFVTMSITVFMAAKAIHASLAEPGSFLHHSSEAGMEIGWLYNDATIDSTKNLVIGLFYDPLGAVLLAVVGIVSFCVHLFSQGYMHGDKRYPIFFANISLFTFAMLGLVLSDNLLFLFIFWELMGAMSYLLIGHFSQDQPNTFFHRWSTWACKKAFLTTRVGDVCLFVGIFIFYRGFVDAWNTIPEIKAAAQLALGEDLHALRFTHMWEMTRLLVEHNHGFTGWMTAGGLFCFAGTVGKSAQFPLHIWLPDAMAGPTPVSAMIHAATMVAAGVFLLGRLFPMLSPEVLEVVVVFGGVTAFFAATIGMTVYDMKAVLAYSTISQLGFMVCAVGLGGVAAGMFHMTTHAFFKACLFLSAGSVIHGCHHMQDMRAMGGLRKKMPITFATTLISTLAIAGFYGFSGFFSKDSILLAAWANINAASHEFLPISGEAHAVDINGFAWFGLIALSVGAAFTAFYMFRLIFMTFFGQYRGNMTEHRYTAQLAAEGYEGPPPHGHDDDHHGDAHGEHDDHGHDDHAHEPHESPKVMTIPLMILALFGLPGMGALLYHWSHMLSPLNMYGSSVGNWVSGHLPGALADYHSPAFDQAAFDHAHHQALLVSLFVASVGIIAAWYLYMRRPELPAKIATGFGGLYSFVRGRYKVDEVVDFLILRPCVKLGALMRWIDEHLVDGTVLLVGRINKAGGSVARWLDGAFVDGLVNAAGLLTNNLGAGMRQLQTGRIQQYAAFAVGGALLTAAWMILS